MKISLLCLGHRYLSTVGYSYWTLGYAISNQGARKLLNLNPLKRLFALDEFLPIAYAKHPNQKWRDQFNLKPEETLKAFTVFPVVVEPEKYTHQPGYISDTESSSIFQETLNETNAINQDMKMDNGMLLSRYETKLVKEEF